MSKKVEHQTLGPRGESLLHARTRMVMLEITSRCNLRCTYCAKSHPGNAGEHMTFELESILPDLERVTPHEIQISGHGESTILEGWSELASRLIERGMPITLTSNFSRVFSESEIAVLAEMEQITISCDTADPEAFRAIRRGAEISSVEENLRNLLARSEVTGRRPYLAINCVLTPRTIGGLCDLVHWAVDNGTQCVSIVQHIDHGDRGSEPAAHSVDCGDGGRLTEILGEAANLARSLGLDFNHMGSVPVPTESGALPPKLEIAPLPRAARAEAPSEKKPVTVPASDPSSSIPDTMPLDLLDTPASPVEPSELRNESPTRDCTDPWKKLYINADGDVSLCCWSNPVGNVQNTALEELRNGGAAMEMRGGLLSGNLPSACAACEVRAWTTAANLQDDVLELDKPEEQPLSFAARRRIREYLFEQQKILGERASLMQEQQDLSDQRQDILEYHHGFRSSPWRLVRALGRACLSPILGKPKSYWNS